MKTLYLVRHAKSSWDDISLADSERPLNKRGLKNAPEMGKRLARRGVSVDQIISSPARRAITTARLIAQEIDFDSQFIQQNERFYFEGSSAMLEIVQQLDPSANSVMLVGHNPDMTALLNGLCGHQVNDMPTSGIATVAFDGEWKSVQLKTGKMQNFDYPKKAKSA